MLPLACLSLFSAPDLWIFNFFNVNPKHNPNSKENSKIRLIVRLRCAACGQCRLSPIRATPKFVAAVTELSVLLLLLLHGHALATFREERRTLYLHHSLASVGFFYLMW